MEEELEFFESGVDYGGQQSYVASDYEDVESSTMDDLSLGWKSENLRKGVGIEENVKSAEVQSYIDYDQYKKEYDAYKKHEEATNYNFSPTSYMLDKAMKGALYVANVFNEQRTDSIWSQGIDNAIDNNQFALDYNGKVIAGENGSTESLQFYDLDAVKGGLLARQKGFTLEKYDEQYAAKTRELSTEYGKEAVTASGGLQMTGMLANAATDFETLVEIIGSPQKVVGETIMKGMGKAFAVEFGVALVAETAREKGVRMHMERAKIDYSLWESAYNVLMGAGLAGVIRGAGSGISDKIALAKIRGRIESKDVWKTIEASDQAILSRFFRSEQYRLTGKVPTHVALMENVERDLDAGKPVDVSGAVDIDLDTKAGETLDNTTEGIVEVVARENLEKNTHNEIASIQKGVEDASAYVEPKPTTTQKTYESDPFEGMATKQDGEQLIAESIDDPEVAELMKQVEELESTIGTDTIDGNVIASKGMDNIAAGVVAGVEEDEEGNITFDPAKFVAGLGGYTAAKAFLKNSTVRQEFKDYATRRLDEFEKTKVGGAVTGKQNIIKDEPTAENLSQTVSKAKPITMKDLEGKTIVPIVADLTKAGDAYKGIDSAVTEPVELMGGPNYPLLASSKEGGLVWANKGKSVGTKLKKAADEDGFVYGVVTGMKRDSHASNTTAVHAILETIKSYETTGRLLKEDAHKVTIGVAKKGKALENSVVKPKELTAKEKKLSAAEKKKIKTANEAKATQATRDKQRIGKYLSNIPEFSDIDKAIKYIDNMPFEARKTMVEVFRSAAIQRIDGMPSINKILNKIIEKEYAGSNWGDAQMVIKIDTNKVVDLGKDGFKNHPSYDYGIQGEVVGKLERPMNYKQLFPDFLASRRTEGKGVAGDPRAFDLSSPAQKVTPEMVNAMPSTAYKAIKSPQQARMVVDAKNNNWKTSDNTVKEGGVSTTDFATALVESDASGTLKPYTSNELKKYIKSDDVKLYRLGDSQAFFALKKNVDYSKEYDNFSSPELTGKETALISVVNNEQNAPKTGALLVAKAIEDGAEVLDAFAVPIKGKPDGLLPQFYSKFGFEEVGRIEFDPKYSTKTELNDIMHYWKSQGWDESQGFPSVVVMKWKGQPDDRTNFTSKLLSGSNELFTKGSSGLDGIGIPRPGSNGGKQVKGDKSIGSGSDAIYGKESRRGGANDVSAISSEIDNLSELELKNLGL